MLSELKVKEFVDMVASNSPAPGGGSVAALSCALGAGLISMLANLTVGKAGYESVHEKMQVIATKAKQEADKFVLTIDEDTRAFDKYMEAIKMPKNSDEEKAIRSKCMQEAAKNAALVPLNLALGAFNLIETARFCAKEGNKNATSDGLVALSMLKAGISGAIENVRINLFSIKDEEFVRNTTKQIEDLENQIS